MKDIKFILVDDDFHNNNICKLYIKYGLPSVEVVCFTFPELGLEYLEHSFFTSNKTFAILLLDINMPQMTGWDFLEKYALLNTEIRNQITIYILSSSVDELDKKKAEQNQIVKGYFQKPLEIEDIKRIYNENMVQ